MPTDDIVAFDLEIRHRMGLGSLGEHEVPVGLECRRPFGALVDLEQAREDGLCLVFDGALEKDVGPLRELVIFRDLRRYRRVEIVDVGNTKDGLQPSGDPG